MILSFSIPKDLYEEWLEEDEIKKSLDIFISEDHGYKFEMDFYLYPTSFFEILKSE